MIDSSHKRESINIDQISGSHQKVSGEIQEETAMEQFKLCESEYRFADIVWENEPMGSGELVKLCEERLGWKKSTTYTVLKKLCEKGVLKNENAVVTALIKQEQIRRYESEQIVNRAFDGSLPQFIAAFMGDKKLTGAQADKLKNLIDSFKEE